MSYVCRVHVEVTVVSYCTNNNIKIHRSCLYFIYCLVQVKYSREGIRNESFSVACQLLHDKKVDSETNVLRLRLSTNTSEKKKSCLTQCRGNLSANVVLHFRKVKLSLKKYAGHPWILLILKVLVTFASTPVFRYKNKMSFNPNSNYYALGINTWFWLVKGTPVMKLKHQKWPPGGANMSLMCIIMTKLRPVSIPNCVPYIQPQNSVTAK